MDVGRFFKKLFGIVQDYAPLAVTIFFPQFLPILNLTLDAILAAEAKFGTGNGAEKAKWVSELMAVFAPRVVEVIEQATKKELADEGLFQEAMADISNGLVKAMNAFRILPKKATAIAGAK